MNLGKITSPWKVLIHYRVGKTLNEKGGNFLNYIYLENKVVCIEHLFPQVLNNNNPFSLTCLFIRRMFFDTLL